jgi:hypothetical protein
MGLYCAYCKRRVKAMVKTLRGEGQGEERERKRERERERDRDRDRERETMPLLLAKVSVLLTGKVSPRRSPGKFKFASSASLKDVVICFWIPSSSYSPGISAVNFKGQNLILLQNNKSHFNKCSANVLLSSLYFLLTWLNPIHS